MSSAARLKYEPFFSTSHAAQILEHKARVNDVPLFRADAQFLEKYAWEIMIMLQNNSVEMDKDSSKFSFHSPLDDSQTAAVIIFVVSSYRFCH